MQNQTNPAGTPVPYQLLTQKDVLKREALNYASILDDQYQQVRKMLEYPTGGRTTLREKTHQGTVSQNYKQVFEATVNDLYSKLISTLGISPDPNNPLILVHDDSDFNNSSAAFSNNADLLRSLANQL